MNKLTDKQKRFCEEYLKDLNTTKAAKRAGYSKKTAYSIGQKLLKKVEVKSRIDNLISKREKRTEITADRVVQELAKIAFSEIDNFIEWDENGIRIQSLVDISKKEIGCIAEFSESITDKSMNLKFKLYDKVKSLELLGKHLGIFIEDNKQKGINVNVNRTEHYVIEISEKEASEKLKKLNSETNRIKDIIKS